MIKKTSLRAVNLPGGKAGYVLLFGGSRSGKTFITTYALLVRAPGSRHAVLRLHSPVRLGHPPEITLLTFASR